MYQCTHIMHMYFVMCVYTQQLHTQVDQENGGRKCNFPPKSRTSRCALRTRACGRNKRPQTPHTVWTTRERKPEDGCNRRRSEGLSSGDCPWLKIQLIKNNVPCPPAAVLDAASQEWYGKPQRHPRMARQHGRPATQGHRGLNTAHRLPTTHL